MKYKMIINSYSTARGVGLKEPNNIMAGNLNYRLLKLRSKLSAYVIYLFWCPVSKCFNKFILEL